MDKNNGDVCEICGSLLPEYIGGSLEGMDKAAVVIHLAGCEHCRRQAAELIKLRNAAASMNAAAPVEAMAKAFAALPDKPREPDFTDTLGQIKAEMQGAYKTVSDALWVTRRTMKAVYNI